MWTVASQFVHARFRAASSSHEGRAELADSSPQVIIAGQRGAEDTEALLNAAESVFAPDKVSEFKANEDGSVAGASSHWLLGLLNGLCSRRVVIGP